MPEVPDVHLKAFLIHAVAILVVAILCMLTPLYVSTTSEGEVYMLMASGWTGDPMASYALNTTNTSDYPMVLWACWLGVAGSLLLLVTSLVQRKGTVSLWGTLAALAWVPVIVACLFLAADRFPMPAFTATLAIADFEVKITAGWGVALWAQAVLGSIALGGAVVLSRQKVPASSIPVPQKTFLEDPAFLKLQAELVIRQSYAGPNNEISERSSG